MRSSAEEIIARRRSKSSVDDLINLDESVQMPPDQDHNDLTVNEGLHVQKESVSELQSLVTSLNLACAEKDERLKNFAEQMKLKDDTNNMLVAKANSLEEALRKS